MEKATVTFKGEHDLISIDFVLDEAAGNLDYKVTADPSEPTVKSKFIYFLAYGFLNHLIPNETTDIPVQDDSGQ